VVGEVLDKDMFIKTRFYQLATTYTIAAELGMSRYWVVRQVQRLGLERPKKTATCRVCGSQIYQRSKVCYECYQKGLKERNA
jgi:ribosomal protein L37E